MTLYISFEKCVLMTHSYYIILYFHVQIDICCNEIDSDNIIHVSIQAKTANAVNGKIRPGRFRGNRGNCRIRGNFALPPKPNIHLPL